ncbi:MAG: hypothetical protein ACLFN7_04895 [Candidatus Acetothermia bacterium]
MTVDEKGEDSLDSPDDQANKPEDEDEPPGSAVLSVHFSYRDLPPGSYPELAPRPRTPASEAQKIGTEYNNYFRPGVEKLDRIKFSRVHFYQKSSRVRTTNTIR